MQFGTENIFLFKHCYKYHENKSIAAFAQSIDKLVGCSQNITYCNVTMGQGVNIWFYGWVPGTLVLYRFHNMLTQIWGVYCQYFGENWAFIYNDTALYISKLQPWWIQIPRTWCPRLAFSDHLQLVFPEVPVWVSALPCNEGQPCWRLIPTVGDCKDNAIWITLG